MSERFNISSDVVETREIRLDDIEIREVGEDILTISGHPAVFGERSEDLGGFTEFVHRKAFKRTLDANPDVVLNVNHDGLPLADTVTGTLRLRTDRTGLRMEADLDKNDPDVQRILPKLRRGTLRGMSFAFRTIEDRWEVKDGENIRTLLEVDLHRGDVSFVTRPAYPQTDVALRSLQAWKNEQEGPQEARTTVEGDEDTPAEVEERTEAYSADRDPDVLRRRLQIDEG